MKLFPEVKSLFGPDPRTLIYVAAVMLLHGGTAAICAYYSSMTVAVVLGFTVGPYLAQGILALIHELSHNRCTGVIFVDRLLGIASNTLILAPLSEIFRQHHTAHHASLGDDRGDVDVPSRVEVLAVGNNSVLKALWLAFNIIILPIRSLLRLEVRTDAYVVLNWIACLSFTAAVIASSATAATYLGISLFFSQGLHPANARQLQRHYCNKQAGIVKTNTYSHYGFWGNALFLNVGYHIEHHDFAQIPWTRLPELRAIAGKRFYPDNAAYESRGMWDVYNFVVNPACSLADFYDDEHDKKM